MNVDFDITMAASKNVGVIADPLALTTSGTNPYGTRNIAANTYKRFIYPVILTGFSIVGDLVDSPMQIGYWDTVGSTFTLLYDVEATELEGGGIVRDLGDGVYVPLSATVVMAVKNRTDDKAVRVSGDMRFHFPALGAAEAAIVQAYSFSTYILDEQGFILLDEDTGAPLVQES